jgi:hypothetical protein
MTDQNAAVINHPNLYYAARKDHRAGRFETWIMLRSTPTASQGWVSLNDGFDWLSSQFNLSLKTAQGRIRSDDGTFWTVDKAHGRIWIHSVQRVWEAIDGMPMSRAQRIPISEFRGIAKRRAILHTAWLASRVQRDGMTKPLAHETIKRKTGLSSVTQRRYQQLAGVTAHRTDRTMPYRDTPEAEALHGVWTSEDGTAMQRNSNRYSVPAEIERAGNWATKRANRTLPAMTFGANAGTRRYHYSANSFNKDHNPGERYLLVKTNARTSVWYTPEAPFFGA